MCMLQGNSWWTSLQISAESPGTHKEYGGQMYN